MGKARKLTPYAPLLRSAQPIEIEPWKLAFGWLRDPHRLDLNRRKPQPPNQLDPIADHLSERRQPLDMKVLDADQQTTVGRIACRLKLQTVQHAGGLGKPLDQASFPEPALADVRAFDHLLFANDPLGAMVLDHP